MVTDVFTSVDIFFASAGQWTGNNHKQVLLKLLIANYVTCLMYSQVNMNPNDDLVKGNQLYEPSRMEWTTRFRSIEWSE